jgi:hypothetical protein
VIPIVNENDTVAVQELRIGDNDTLSAQVATLVQADWLFLLTDVPNLFTANPNTNPDAQPIYEVHDLGRLQVRRRGKTACLFFGGGGCGGAAARKPGVVERGCGCQPPACLAACSHRAGAAAMARHSSLPCFC